MLWGRVGHGIGILLIYGGTFLLYFSIGTFGCAFPLMLLHRVQLSHVSDGLYPDWAQSAPTLPLSALL